MMNDIKFFCPMHFLRNRERFLGKPDVFLPLLYPGQKPVGMPLLEFANIKKPDVGRDQSFRLRPLQLGPEATAGNHAYFMVLRQAFYRGPSKVTFRTLIRTARFGGHQYFHRVALKYCREAGNAIQNHNSTIASPQSCPPNRDKSIPLWACLQAFCF